MAVCALGCQVMHALVTVLGVWVSWKAMRTLLRCASQPCMPGLIDASRLPVPRDLGWFEGAEGALISQLMSSSLPALVNGKVGR